MSYTVRQLLALAVLALAIGACLASTADEKTEDNVVDLAEEEEVEKIFTFQLQEPLEMTVDQLVAREFSDPGWEITDTVSTDIEVLYALPSGLRRGDVGTYQITYKAYPVGETTGAPLATQQRTVIVTDIDECALGLDDCGAHAHCKNTIGSFECICDKGYRGDGRSCVDIDECVEGTHDCDKNAACENTEGSYECTCNAGFEGDGRVCEDVDECARGTHDCHAFATCTNTVGSFECACKENYDGDGRVCVPRNPCTPGEHDCDVHAHCTKHEEGSGYDCLCFSGFEGDGHTCTDIDECARGIDDCPPHSECKNTEGGYDCECVSGYEMVGSVCKDIDECARGTHLCDANAVCENTAGGYLCSCKDGFEGDGRECVSTKAPWFTLKGDNPLSIAQFSVYKEVGLNVMDREDEEVFVRVQIPAQLDGVAKECGTFPISYTVSNQLGYESTKTRDVRVTPTDQCKLAAEDSSHPYAARCHPYAVCKHSARDCSYTCVCPTGYEGDGEDCVDRIPPIIPGDFEDPYPLAHCIVCDEPIGQAPDLHQPIITYAYDPTPSGGRLAIAPELTVTEMEGNDTCVLHTYRATDAAGNFVERDLTVCRTKEDMRKIIMEMKEFYDWQIWFINTALYSLLTAAIAFSVWRFGATVGSVMKVFVLGVGPAADHSEDYIAAYTAVYRLLNPFAASNEIKRKVFNKLDELMEGH
mmetsp:Transcript_1949/g.7006  ORF Transcript_1949/g.7006 Transcript_1949/m.7006 type:complete len:701 (-) Transcript_1949:217-2319(-)|eukprot:CAMPEP_0114618290 /NCGR_PEP_ID=MMETSP0168-20121206/7628_1 /TAXON_ID=95228 ORGANISM="Vannella sp., Strain DIVA3 517/6/12" /NCGR_SAMPLE_ID=MMETSP0168 /ASSEMBLY_ACC=CAM_ASM_000044 /LENGTH=700 /DNA_ID=CAMNT_0001829435 /DNA_START=235 /DNA_END=2337 /DNA_ORIENTATION=+